MDKNDAQRPLRLKLNYIKKILLAHYQALHKH